MKLRIIQNTLMAVVLSITIAMMFERWQESSVDASLFILQRELEDSSNKSSTRLEDKINRIGYLSDSHQLDTVKKIKTIEQRLDELQGRVDSIEEQLQSIKNNKT